MGIAEVSQDAATHKDTHSICRNQSYYNACSLLNRYRSCSYIHTLDEHFSAKKCNLLR
jgi:hypothetical protein